MGMIQLAIDLVLHLDRHLSELPHRTATDSSTSSTGRRSVPL